MYLIFHGFVENLSILFASDLNFPLFSLQMVINSPCSTHIASGHYEVFHVFHDWNSFNFIVIVMKHFLTFAYWNIFNILLKKRKRNVKNVSTSLLKIVVKWNSIHRH